METGELYRSYKPLLFSLAYRMLGSVMDAEDIVHEAFLAINGKEWDDGENIKAYLCKIVTNRCIDRLRSAAYKREVYVGPWLPEPVVAEGVKSDPAQYYVAKEDVSTAFLLLLEQLSALERAVFLLREVLAYDYEEIAAIVGKSSMNCRQIFHRAKKSIPQQPVPPQEERQQSGRLLEEFTQALYRGDVNALLRLLSADAVCFTDGGGKVHAAIVPIRGSQRVAMFLQGVFAKLPASWAFHFAQVNGQPGMVFYENERITYAVSFEYRDGQIASIFAVANPDKLAHLNR